MTYGTSPTVKEQPTMETIRESLTRNKALLIGATAHRHMARYIREGCDRDLTYDIDRAYAEAERDYNNAVREIDNRSYEEILADVFRFLPDFEATK